MVTNKVGALIAADFSWAKTLEEPERSNWLRFYEVWATGAEGKSFYEYVAKYGTAKGWSSFPVRG